MKVPKRRCPEKSLKGRRKVQATSHNAGRTIVVSNCISTCAQLFNYITFGAASPLHDSASNESCASLTGFSRGMCTELVECLKAEIGNVWYRVFLVSEAEAWTTWDPKRDGMIDMISHLQALTDSIEDISPARFLQQEKWTKFNETVKPFIEAAKAYVDIYQTTDAFQSGKGPDQPATMLNTLLNRMYKLDDELNGICNMDGIFTGSKQRTPVPVDTAGFITGGISLLAVAVIVTACCILRRRAAQRARQPHFEASYYHDGYQDVPLGLSGQDGHPSHV